MSSFGNNESGKLNSMVAWLGYRMRWSLCKAFKTDEYAMFCYQNQMKGYVNISPPLEF